MGTWDWNITTDQVVYNRRWAEMLGYDLAELDPHMHSWEQLLHPDDLFIVNRVIQDHLIGLTHSYSTEHRLRHKEGHWIWVLDKGRVIERDSSGNPLRACGTHLDITDRKLAEEEHRIGEERHRQILQTAIDGVWRTDTTGRLLEVNQAYCRMSGYSEQELLAMSIADLEVEETAQGTAAQMQKLVENGEDRFESRHRRKDGSLFDVEVSTQYRHRKGGGECVAFLRDITERKRLDKEREITIQLLKHLNKPNDIHELMSGITNLMRDWSGCEAVGIRLRQGDDFPYFETSGFPTKFVRAENSLCQVDSDGDFVRDSLGNAVLECMCGNVVRGRFNPSLPFFTENGSFWTNSTTDLLASTTEDDRQARTRNRCHGEGYESVALIPLRYGDESLGLLQFNDSCRDRFDERQIALFERLAASLALGLLQTQTAISLKASQERYQDIEATIPGVLCQFSMNPDGTWMTGYISKQGESLFERPLSELVEGSLLFADVHPEDLPDLQDSILRANENMESWAHEFRIVTRQNKVKWLQMAANPREVPEVGTLWNGVVLDATKQKRAEEALKLSEEKFRLAFNTSPDAININRMHDGLYVAINQGFTDLTGFTAHDVMGKTSLEINIWADPQDRQKLVEGLRENGYYENLEANFRRKDGSLLTALMSARIISLEGVPHLLSITRDISARLKTEEEKGRLESQLRQAQKMEAVGTLAGGIAHDFNNILAAVSGFAEIAREDAREGRVDPQDLDQIIASVQRAKNLVRQILTFSRKNEPVLQPVSLNQAVKQAQGILERTLPKMVSIETELAPKLPPVQADPTQIEQVLLNLASNSADAMPDGGRLVLATRVVIPDEGIHRDHPEIPLGDYVLLTVSDTGVGLDQVTREHIFEPFFTTKGVGKGTGLGLSTVYGIVKTHGGFIYCQSEIGKGATFSIYLPAMAIGRPANQAEAAADDETALHGNETILLVDDEYAIRTIASRILRNAGYQVLEASSGEEALKTYAEQPNPPDMVITDLGMPGMGGHKAMVELIARHPGARVVIASGYSAQAQVKGSLEAGGAAFVAKPFRKAELLAIVRSVLDNH